MPVEFHFLTLINLLIPITSQSNLTLSDFLFNFIIYISFLLRPIRIEPNKIGKLSLLIAKSENSV